jgi:hypothetical protein|nr:MAG TPA: hypothetical protein [Bacteriophage sp.]DAW59878.1 MAG TPA: hypothetical protein [Caudoviricetes sp.]
MNYCIVNADNIIENIIVCESDEVAAQFGAVASYDGAAIGEAYNPPPPPPTTEERVAALEAASDRLDAQATYTAMMTDTLMEG